MTLGMIPANEDGVDADRTRNVSVNGRYDRNPGLSQLLLTETPQPEMEVGDIGIVRNLGCDRAGGSFLATSN